MDTKTLTETENVLTEMLTENTGTHFLDSGGAYGRNWEKNQGADFISEPDAYFDQWGGVTFNLFHWLNARLDYNAELDGLFGEFAALPENEDEHWLSLMESFPAWLADEYGDEYPVLPEACTVNSYNSECALSQTIQFTLFGTAHDAVWGEYVLLQIHGGCDVRGGYTRPRVFNTGDADMLDFNQVELFCEGVEPNTDEVLFGEKPRKVYHSWYSENAGYSWYGNGDFDGSFGNAEELDLTSDDGNVKCPLCSAKLNVGWRPVG